MAFLLGITGQIGSGKSTAARILKSYGGIVVDADVIGRQVVDGSPQLLAMLAKQFGSDILSRSGKLDRRKVAARAFVDDKSRNALNRIVHPYLLKELCRQVEEARQSNAFVIVDAALLFDWDFDCKLDLSLVIHTSYETRLARMEAKGFDPADVQARMKMQLPFAVFRSRADHLILNNGSLRDLERKLSKFFKKFIQNRLDRS